MSLPSSLSLLTLWVACAAAVALPPLPATTATNDWDVEPDPPTESSDLEVCYNGDESSVSYQLEGEAIQTVDVSENGSFTIPKAKLKGKSFVRLMAGGGERGYVVISIRKSR